MKPDFISDDLYNARLTKHCIPQFYIDNILPSSFISRCERKGISIPFSMEVHTTKPNEKCKAYKVGDVIEVAIGMGLTIKKSKEEIDSQYKIETSKRIARLSEEKNYLEFKIRQMKEEIDHLEPITMTSKNMGFALPSYKRIISSCVSVEDNIACGVYFLVRCSEVVYVGQSLNVYARVQQHKREGIKDFDSFSFLQCEEGRLNEIEQMYIKFLDPEYNITHSPSNQGFSLAQSDGWAND